MSSKSRFNKCCEGPKRYVVSFLGEKLVRFCEKHFSDEDILLGAVLIHDLKLKKNVEVPAWNF